DPRSGVAVDPACRRRPGQPSESDRRADLPRATDSDRPTHRAGAQLRGPARCVRGRGKPDRGLHGADARGAWRPERDLRRDLAGQPHQFFFRDPAGTMQPETLRLAGNTLLWEDGALTYRLEAQVSLEEAVRIASSLR